MVNGSPGTAEREGDRHLTAMAAELPGDLTGRRLLEVAHPDRRGSAAAALAGRGAEEIVESERPGDLLDEREGDFDFVLCCDALRSDPYPLALLTHLWRLAAPAGVLLLDSEVVAAPEHSQYARFLPISGSSAGWVPGRLALRWMVETSGFDVERWLGERAPAGTHASLRAVRADRIPARSAPG